MLYPALRKLPGMLPNPLPPEYLIFVIRDNDADIRAVAVSVYHFSLYQVNFNMRILSHFTFIEKRIYTIDLPSPGNCADMLKTKRRHVNAQPAYSL